jgi:hypothetical protein
MAAWLIGETILIETDFQRTLLSVGTKYDVQRGGPRVIGTHVIHHPVHFTINV